MSEWKDYNLGQVVDVDTGFAFKSQDYSDEGQLKVVRGKNVTVGKMRWGVDAKYWNHSTDGLERYFLDEFDIVIGMDGSKIGENRSMIKRVDLPAILAQRVARIKAKNMSADQHYVWHLVFSDPFMEYIRSIHTGTSIPHISQSQISDYQISLPPLPEQKAIASVLSSLDDKIDLLHRQNKTLEAMAETLFRQWFVPFEFAQGTNKEGWKEGKLSDEFDFTMGQSPPGTSFNETGAGAPMFQGNADFGIRFPKERIYTTEPKRFAYKNDTLISVRAPVGAQNMANHKCCIGRGVAAFRYKHNSNYYTYTYFKLRSLMDEIKQFNDEGTVFGSIGKTDFQQMETILPPDKVITKYENRAKPLNDKIIANCNQIHTLEKLRDNLLPKLMNGEVRVA